MADQTPQDLDLTPEVINIECQQGTHVTVEFRLTEDGAALDITNDTIKVTVKDGFGGITMITTITKGPGEHSDPTDGKTLITWTKAMTTTPFPTDELYWKYEVRRVAATSLAEVVYIHGDFKLMPSVGTAV
jgi:hypothetical protein